MDDDELIAAMVSGDDTALWAALRAGAGTSRRSDCRRSGADHRARIAAIRPGKLSVTASGSLGEYRAAGP